MTAQAIITAAIQTRTDETKVLLDYRRKLRKMSDLLTSSSIIEKWTIATQNIDSRLKHQGIPQ